MKRLMMLSVLVVSALNAQVQPPTIQHFEWGSITVNYLGKNTVYNSTTKGHSKDCKLFPGGSSPWDWTKTNLHHSPGIAPADLEDFIDDVDVVILSQGVDGVLKTRPETFVYLKEKKKEVYHLLSPDAVKLYNELVAQGKKRIGALIHSTC
jgi:hypothetical protein